LRSAERLFAERGYAAVSVRDIAAEARVPVALVGYYFGRKEQLFSTVFEHRKAYIVERIERMSAVDCSSANPRAVDDLVRAWAEPAVELRAHEAGEAFSLLVARTAWDSRPEVTEIIKRFYDPLASVFIDKICQALPDCSRERLIWGYEYALGGLLMLIADKRVERLSNGAIASGDPNVLDQFVQFVTSGFRAL